MAMLLKMLWQYNKNNNRPLGAKQTRSIGCHVVFRTRNKVQHGRLSVYVHAHLAGFNLRLDTPCDVTRRVRVC